MQLKYGVTAIGNAIVDVLVPATEAFVSEQEACGMQRGGMTLIDAARAAELCALIGPATEMSGGSAGNTMAAYASFGGSGAYIGKVADDQLGRIFSHDIRALGVDFNTAPLERGAPTAQCLILVTPDAQRTMNTFLGACTKLGVEDIDEDLIAASEVTYLEGYLFDEPEAKKAFYFAAELVRKHGRKLALTLSDSFCVNRYRDEFHDLIKNHVDILFANEAEIKALFQVATVAEAASAVAHLCGIAAITLGAEGSLIVAGKDEIKVAASPPAALVDTTGAGDVYAAGFLFGLTAGKPLTECGRLASLAAAEIISHMGPRPQVELKTMLQAA